MSTSSNTIIKATSKRVTAASQWLAADLAAKAATAALKEARDVLLRAVTEDGVIQTPRGDVVINTRLDRRFDVEALADLVDDETFANVTKVSVDAKSFDAYVLTGDVSDEVEEAVVSFSPTKTIKAV